MGSTIMQHTYKILGLGLIALGLSACQSAPQQYNGQVGYRIEAQSTDSATLAYTLAARKNQQLDENKLQRACQKVLNNTKTYKITILSVNEIINPSQNVEFGKQIGNSRTTVGLSNTLGLYSDQDTATLRALETRPPILNVVRYTCS